MTFTDTNIRWCDKVWNPIHGCSKVSEGCRGCYAERVSNRFGHTDHPWTIEHLPENLTFKEHYLNDRLSEPAWVFVNSMSDLYHPAVPDGLIEQVYDVIEAHSASVFLILTKHGPEAGRELPPAPSNALVGVSVESPRRRYRIDWLRDQPVEHRFISFEPLIEHIHDVDLGGIDWAIIGGESGGTHPDDLADLPPDSRQQVFVRRPMAPEWARSLLWLSWSQDVPVFFKQHSGPRPEERITISVTGVSKPKRVEQWPDLPGHLVPIPRKHAGGGSP